LKIISPVGSPHGLKGNTARLLSHVLEGAKAEGAKTETMVLAGTNVLPCLACDTCHRKGRCPQKDEFESSQAHQQYLEVSRFRLAFSFSLGLP
jgi:multimeric flavodoxin WrbA